MTEEWVKEWLAWLVSFNWIPPWVGKLDPLLGVGGVAVAVLVWYLNSRRRPALMRRVVRLERLLMCVEKIRRDPAPDATKREKKKAFRMAILMLIIIVLLAVLTTIVPNRTWYWIIVVVECFLAVNLVRFVLWSSAISKALRHWPDAPAKWIVELVEVRMKRAGFSEHERAKALTRLFDAVGNDKKELSNEVVGRISGLIT